MIELQDYQKAKEFALKAHKDTNQMYHDQLYSKHLYDVNSLFVKYLHLLPKEDVDDVAGGCWCHDVIEDTGKTYNDVLRATNETIANYAFALTNEKGKNRKERANEKYYEGIRQYKHATFIKLCDRIANVSFSKLNGSSMLKTYQKEHLFMVQHLYDGRFEEMWQELSRLIYS